MLNVDNCRVTDISTIIIECKSLRINLRIVLIIFVKKLKRYIELALQNEKQFVLLRYKYCCNVMHNKGCLKP